MPSSGSRLVWIAALVAAPIACSLAYRVDPLSNGESASGAGGGAGAGAGATGATGGAATSSSAAGGAAGSGGCRVATDCDDGKPCTKDECMSGRCTNSPRTGQPCTGDDPCNDPNGTCNGFGDCATTPISETTTSCNVNVHCPSGYYVSGLACDPFCPTDNGVCGFCINNLRCTWACKDTMIACCGSDCSTACPTGYQPVGVSMKSDQCLACDQPQDAITCAH